MRKTYIDRLFASIDMEGPVIDGRPELGRCWVWLRKCDHDGYGVASYQDSDGIRRRPGAHRWAWTLLRGPIPEGLQLDHLCRRRPCVNPAHLELVTQAENHRRAWGIKKPRPRPGHSPRMLRTHCRYGHEYTESNVYRSGTKRLCKECARRKNRQQYLRRMALTNPRPPLARMQTVLSADRPGKE